MPSRLKLLFGRNRATGDLRKSSAPAEPRGRSWKYSRRMPRTIGEAQAILAKYVDKPLLGSSGSRLAAFPRRRLELGRAPTPAPGPAEYVVRVERPLAPQGG